MYQNPYMPTYNPQASLDRINSQINELQKMKDQIQQQPMPQPTNLTQNFQIAPTNREVIKYATSIDEVQRDMVVGDTPYFSKDMSVVWVKNTKGEIRTYELNEIIPKDSKDLMIESLQMQLNELKGRLNNEQYVTDDDEHPDTTSTSEDDGAVRTATEKSESASISRISKRTKK